jgi:hypothetical protein
MHRHLGAAAVAGIGRIPVGRMRRVCRHATRAHGEPVLHARGPDRSSAPELLANGRLKLFLQRVEPLFDWIILDYFARHPGFGCDAGRRGLRWHSHGRALERDACRSGARAREEFPDKLLLGVVLNGTSAESATFEVLLWRGREQPGLR